MPQNDVTLLLAELNNGSESASAKLIEAVYGELKSMAAAKMRSERPNRRNLADFGPRAIGVNSETTVAHAPCPMLSLGTVPS